MATILTSWKEVARYVGKGVRTVQRWERHMGFPIRRPNPGSKGVVIAVGEEIDRWVGSQGRQCSCDSESELAALRNRVAKLQAENENLRRQLDEIRPKASAQPPELLPKFSPLDTTVLVRCVRLRDESDLLQQQSREIRELSQNLRLLRCKDNSRFSLAFTFCFLAEKHIREGDADEAEKLIATVRDRAQWMRRCLDEFKHASPMMDDMRKDLARLEMRIAGVEAQLWHVQLPQQLSQGQYSQN
jgi:DNA repair exonuclease SbcCD ATPase subunit